MQWPEDQPSKTTPSQTRALISYLDFRKGFPDPAKKPPPWDDLPDYVRDAIVVAYLQGKLDGGN